MGGSGSVGGWRAGGLLPAQRSGCLPPVPRPLPASRPRPPDPPTHPPTSPHTQTHTHTEVLEWSIEKLLERAEGAAASPRTAFTADYMGLSTFEWEQKYMPRYMDRVLQVGARACSTLQAPCAGVGVGGGLGALQRARPRPTLVAPPSLPHRNPPRNPQGPSAAEDSVAILAVCFFLLEEGDAGAPPEFFALMERLRGRVRLLALVTCPTQRVAQRADAKAVLEARNKALRWGGGVGRGCGARRGRAGGVGTRR